MSIQVTSVESERSFSACGLLVTKLRTRDVMSLLKGYSLQWLDHPQDDPLVKVKTKLLIRVTFLTMNK